MKKKDSPKSIVDEGKNLSRREILRLTLLTGAPLVLSTLQGCSKLFVGDSDPVNPDLNRQVATRGPGPLPQPVVNPRSTEICLNSKISYHGGWSGSASENWLGNVLYAAGKAPVTRSPVIIHVATPENLYLYDPVEHALNVHLPGDHRGDSTAAFQLGFGAESDYDAGVSKHLAQVASVALWNGTSSQLGSCPRQSDTAYANSNWSPVETIQIGITFGIRSVQGFKTILEANSSDGSLPDPITDGSIYFDNAVRSFKYNPHFESTPLTLQQLSQLLWSAYGCTVHNTYNGRAGLTIASAVAYYYLTRRIYLVSQMGVHRYHNRIPPGTDLTTKDHRIELLSDTDARNSLRQSITGLPSAPAYFVICVDSAQTSSNWALLEAGFCASSLLVEGTSMRLNTHFRTDFSSGERSSIQDITSIPTSDAPIAIVSSGLPKKVADLNKIVGISPERAIPGPGRP
ncbi:hypothetical protein KKB99_00790 [bacterium]|nr:hypothetical protein [bacterium]MBU1024522.1 hypothetical protein [bacterium]